MAIVIALVILIAVVGAFALVNRMLQQRQVERLMAARDKLRGELVPLKHTGALIPAKDLQAFRIRVERGDLD